ncbi:hypothetical protein ACFSYG_10205 [Leeuwenhoekiella polynyae]|uniref:Uncharacterized protein n=1 Tax=Leeuwenhoekiella polynyae TaxID=1550906 RepID=A0A4Q0PHA7_9FLAO|nr:hypothetical protein [Leeuwenhoekiella polynyae]RXG25619.1 hypothetical protein DSM02_785 [Leeuwenhoekiella polynyae]
MHVIPEKRVSELEDVKQFALLEEFETADRYIKAGFSELQNNTFDTDLYRFPFELVAQGLERFMKAYLCIAHYHTYQKLPDPDYFQLLGQDLETLFEEILDTYYFSFDKKQYQLDIEFLKNSLELKGLIKILSSYGQLSRDENFKVVLGNTTTKLKPSELWFDYRNRFLKQHKNEQSEFRELSYEAHKKLTQHCIILIEKLCAALSRQFIFKRLGEKGLQLASTMVFEYGMLYPQDYGKKNYGCSPEEPLLKPQDKLPSKLMRFFKSNE